MMSGLILQGYVNTVKSKYEDHDIRKNIYTSWDRIAHKLIDYTSIYTRRRH